MNNEPAPEGLSAELEVRIVAFLLGEARPLKEVKSSV